MLHFRHFYIFLSVSPSLSLLVSLAPSTPFLFLVRLSFVFLFLSLSLFSERAGATNLWTVTAVWNHGCNTLKYWVDSEKTGADLCLLSADFCCIDTMYSPSLFLYYICTHTPTHTPTCCSYIQEDPEV